MLKIFGRERESLRIRQARAARAKFMDGPGTEEVEVQLRTDDGQRLDLQIPAHVLPNLIGQLTDAYEAINVPLSRRNNQAAGWDGEGT